MITGLLAIAAAAQALPAVPPAKSPVTAPAKMPFATQFDLSSNNTGQTYRIYVSRPFGTPPKQGWPVVYVLDADVTFATVAAQNVLRATSGQPAALVIGIGYPNSLETIRLRKRDLTPSLSGPHNGDLVPDKPGDSGGAAAFHRFMMDELRPVVATLAKVDPEDQSLIGYSLGGLFVLGVMFDHPDAYRSYVAGSPSIWWNDRELLAKVPGFVARVRAGTAAPRLLMTSGGYEQDPAAPDVPTAEPARSAALKEQAMGAMVTNARALAARLSAVKSGTGYRVRYVLFPQETHLSGIPAAASRGFAFVLAP